VEQTWNRIGQNSGIPCNKVQLKLVRSNDGLLFCSAHNPKVGGSDPPVPNENSVRPMADVIPPNEPRSSSGLRLCLSLVSEIRGGTTGLYRSAGVSFTRPNCVRCRWFDYQHHSMLIDLCDEPPIRERD
jgi:hypothetical protein